MRIEYHRTLIADRVRNEAFRAALAGLIRPGETVVADIGAGTGLMGLFAEQLGAKRVFLYEAAEVAGVAAEVLAANKAKRCELIPCHSTEMRDPPRVDLVVSETLGNYALEENIIATLADARRRHLKPGGSTVPGRIRQFVAPVTSGRLQDELAAWDRVGHGLDLSFARTMSLNNVYVRTIRGDELLGGSAAAVVWDEIDLATEGKSARRGEARWGVDRDAEVHGLAYWWTAELAPRIELSTAPGAPATHWEQLYFPLLEPVRLEAGETLAATLRSRSSEEAGTHLAWGVEVRGARGGTRARQSLNLDKGWLP